MSAKINHDLAPIYADEDKKFGCGDHYVFNVNEHGDLISSELWDAGFGQFVDNTSAVKLSGRFLEQLREYFLEEKEHSHEPDPMDLAREKAIEDWGRDL